MVPADLVLGERPFAEVEDERSFAPVHLLFEAAFVEGAAERVEPVRVAPAAEGDEARAALDEVSDPDDGEKGREDVRRRRPRRCQRLRRGLMP